MKSGSMTAAVLIGVGRAFLSSPEPAGDQKQPSCAPDGIPIAAAPHLTWRVYQRMQDDRVLLVAAGVTFYGLLALFPAIAAIVTLYGVFADASTIGEHLRLLSGFLPGGAVGVIDDQVRRIAAHGQATLGLTFAGTLLLSLWGANAGTKAIIEALNIIYRQKETRSYIRLTLRSLLFTLIAIALVLIALTSIVVVPVALNLLGIPARSGLAFLSALRWPLLFLAILLGLSCLYTYGPSRAQAQWRWATWGSAIATAAWLAGSLLLSWYVSNFGAYNATYGTLGGAMGFIIWLWLSTIIVLLGGELNAEMERRSARRAIQSGG